MKDSLVVTVWILALIPVLPFSIIIMLHDYLEKITDWYDGAVFGPIRNWRNKWNPVKEG